MAGIIKMSNSDKTKFLKKITITPHRIENRKREYHATDIYPQSYIGTNIPII